MDGSEKKPPARSVTLSQREAHVKNRGKISQPTRLVLTEWEIMAVERAIFTIVRDQGKYLSACPALASYEALLQKLVVAGGSNV